MVRCALEPVRDLFMLEHQAMLMPLPERLAHRTELAAPIVTRLWTWVDTWRADSESCFLVSPDEHRSRSTI